MTEYILGEKYLEINTFVASMLSGILNYVLSTIWVFHKKQKKGNILRFIVFTIIGAIGLALNIGITSLLTKVCGIHYLVSNLIAQAIVFFFNFFMRKKIVYTIMSKEEDA
jgi:putative flippase GtrA